MVDGILLGLPCCRTNDAMNIFLLLVIVHARERKVMAVSDLRLFE